MAEVKRALESGSRSLAACREQLLGGMERWDVQSEDALEVDAVEVGWDLATVNRVSYTGQMSAQ